MDGRRRELVSQLNNIISNFNHFERKLNPSAPNYLIISRLQSRQSDNSAEVNEIFMHDINRQEGFKALDNENIIKFADAFVLDQSPIQMASNGVNPLPGTEPHQKPFQNNIFLKEGLAFQGEPLPSATIFKSDQNSTQLHINQELKTSEQINGTGSGSDNKGTDTAGSDSVVRLGAGNRAIKPNKCSIVRMINPTTASEKQDVAHSPGKSRLKLPQLEKQRPNSEYKIHNNVKYYKSELMEQRRKVAQLQQELKDREIENTQLRKERDRFIAELRKYR